jgi:hypothetical protein
METETVLERFLKSNACKFKIMRRHAPESTRWIPAFAGMTRKWKRHVIA